VATVQVRPGILTGSAVTFKIGGTPACLNGDERSATVSGCPYVTPTYPIPGAGTLSVTRLGPGQQAAGIRLKGVAFLVAGGRFVARFEVNRPAQVLLPNGSPVPDPTPAYTGQGYFERQSQTSRPGLAVIIRSARPRF
jgi:hypothetical protein